ncbi:MAG: hypothetical protein ISS52_03205 [Dehalococcoidia bacterium]|nr:hypothetical protein [Dehalococcoidia bacterium]
MPKRSSKEETPKDINELAAFIAEATTTEPRGKNVAAVFLGRLGGKKGGIARANKLSAKQRSEIARKAAQTRWKKTIDS